MKTIIRFAALAIVLAGAAAASFSSNARTLASHQSATAHNPIPLCAPGLPNCPRVAAER